MENIHSFSIFVCRLSSLVLIIMIVISLISNGAAQAFSVTPSEGTQTMSQTNTQSSMRAFSQSSQAAFQTEPQRLSVPGSQATPPTVSQTVLQTATETSSIQDVDENFSFDESYDSDQQDMIKTAFKDAARMISLTQVDWSDFDESPPFMEMFGSQAIFNASAIGNTLKDMLSSVSRGAWTIATPCDLKGEAEACKSKYMYGGISEDPTGNVQPDYSPRLVFCGEFFTFPPLDYRVQMGLNAPGIWTSRFDLGFYHEYQYSHL
jgi:hypothetical protein